MSDLAPLCDSSGLIRAKSYLELFEKQRAQNFGKLERLPIASLRRHLNAHSRVLNVITSSARGLLSAEIISRHEELSVSLKAVKNELLDRIIAARTHLTAIRDDVRAFDPALLFIFFESS